MRYLLITISMMIAIGLSAQRGERGDRLEQQRIAYITTELDLSVDEAQAFWPIYNEYQNQRKANSKDKIAQKDIDQISEQEAEKLLKDAMEDKKRYLASELDFVNKLEGVLPATKRLKLMRMEREFKKKVLKRYQKRMKRDEKRKDKMEKKKEREER